MGVKSRERVKKQTDVRSRQTYLFTPPPKTFNHLAVEFERERRGGARGRTGGWGARVGGPHCSE